MGNQRSMQTALQFAVSGDFKSVGIEPEGSPLRKIRSVLFESATGFIPVELKLHSGIIIAIFDVRLRLNGETEDLGRVKGGDC